MSDQIETKDQNHRHNFEWVTLPGEAPAAARTIRQCSCGTSLFNAFKDLVKQLAERDAALARCVEAAQWRPAATAPYDTRVLAWLHLPKNPIASHFAVAQRVFVQEDEPESYGEFRRTVGSWWANGRCYEAGHVTHWMPLPEPPEAIREEQADRSSETS